MKQPKTIEEWEEYFSEHQRGAIILQRDLYNSKAFLELQKKPSHLSVYLAAVEQVYYEKKGKTKSKRNVLKNGGRVYLPQNLLKARGIRSNATIAEAKRRLVELGFLDVVETGSVHNAAVFRVSERWSKYPNGDYLPKNQRPPGKSLYGEHGLRNPEHPVNKKRGAKKQSVQNMNETPVR